MRDGGPGVVPVGLRTHWSSWLGATAAQVARLRSDDEPDDEPGTTPLLVVASPRRAQPCWDGSLSAVAGVVDPHGRAVVSVSPAHAADAAELARRTASVDALRAELPTVLGIPDQRIYRATCRWSASVPPDSVLADVGQWVPVHDPRLPPWLHPFGHDALVAFDDEGDGSYLAGVGLKRHDEHVHEIAVGTADAARGRGLARRLVAQAARELHRRGIVATYLHDPRNAASGRVADAAGFPDYGWTVLGTTPHPAT